MPKCTSSALRLSPFGRRVVEADFHGGAITSDAGALLLREVEQRTGMLRGLARRLDDRRQRRRCRHDLGALLRQRVFASALGYEDLNDHQELRGDVAFQTAVSRDVPLASASTLCRLEQRSDARFVWAAHEVLIEQFVAAFDTPPQRLTLDFDATDDLVHGEQAGRHFSGFYGGYCFLPLYVFCGEHLLVSYLRPAYRGSAHHAAAILRLLVRRLRAHWPGVEIVLRGDGDFCTPKLLHACQRLGVDYIVGFANNDRLKRDSAPLLDMAEALHRLSGQQPVRLFSARTYKARSWKRASRLITKAEHNGVGRNRRFVITSLTGNAQALYDEIYCARGDMENRIKDQQLDLYADRTSAQAWWANQFRLLVASLAYALLTALRRLALADTRYARASPGRLRERLLKIGAVVRRNTRRVQLHLASHCPDQDLIRLLVHRLAPG